MKVSLTEDECYSGLLSFYKVIGTKLNKQVTEFTGFDCRKIRVTKPVMEFLIRFHKDNGIYGGDIPYIMVCYGPKPELEGDALEAEIDDGFIVPSLAEE